MLELSQKKKDVIIQGDVAELERIVQAEQLVMSQIMAIERARHEAATALARERGLPEGEVSFSQLVQLARGEEREQLEAFRQEFSHVLQEQTLINELNRSLIETQLQFINITLDAVVQAQEGNHNNYTSEGEAGARAQRIGIIDTEI